jgi:hypothetical protein
VVIYLSNEVRFYGPEMENKTKTQQNRPGVLGFQIHKEFKSKKPAKEKKLAGDVGPLSLNPMGYKIQSRSGIDLVAWYYATPRRPSLGDPRARLTRARRTRCPWRPP